MDWQQAFAYDGWATRQLMEALAPLPEGWFTAPVYVPPAGVPTSLRQQFWHLLSVQDRYRARIMEEDVPDTPMDSIGTLAQLRHYESEVRIRLEALLEALPGLPLQRETAHATRRGTYHATVEDTLWHMMSHSTYHRGQIAALLKDYGADFPDTDVILWLNRPGA